MKLRSLGLAFLFSALAMPALAVVKVYNASPPGGTTGDQFQFSTTLCPPIQTTPGVIQGSYTLTDTSGGTVTLTDFNQHAVTFVNLGTDQLTTIFGPGSFVFVNATPTISLLTVPTAAGSTGPAGTVAWGVLSGFQSTGVGFCVASPQTICSGGSMLPHGITSPLSPVSSSTYDLGTWSFDAADGDLLALNNYINQTNNGGTANRQRLIRGAYVGAAIPALPLVGAGALAIGLLIAGTRTIMRKK